MLWCCYNSEMTVFHFQKYNPLNLEKISCFLINYLLFHSTKKGQNQVVSCATEGTWIKTLQTKFLWCEIQWNFFVKRELKNKQIKAKQTIKLNVLIWQNLLHCMFSFCFRHSISEFFFLFLFSLVSSAAPKMEQFLDWKGYEKLYCCKRRHMKMCHTQPLGLSQGISIWIKQQLFKHDI